MGKENLTNPRLRLVKKKTNTKGHNLETKKVCVCVWGGGGGGGGEGGSQNGGIKERPQKICFAVAKSPNTKCVFFVVVVVFGVFFYRST